MKRRIRVYEKLAGWTEHLVDAPDPRFGGVMVEGVLRCHDCKAPMQLRKRRKDGRFFFGCYNYPTCRRTHPSDPHGHPVFPMEEKEKAK